MKNRTLLIICLVLAGCTIALCLIYKSAKEKTPDCTLPTPSIETPVPATNTPVPTTTKSIIKAPTATPTLLPTATATPLPEYAMCYKTFSEMSEEEINENKDAFEDSLQSYLKQIDIYDYNCKPFDVPGLTWEWKNEKWVLTVK